MITAAKDADSVRVAMQSGALHYLLKPFSFPVLRDKLLSYAQMRTRLSAVREADQRTVDRVFGALRAPDQLAGAKGRSVHTLEAVEQLLMETANDLSAAEVAERTGMSRATAQRYLSHLHEVGRVDIRLRYGSGGRPEHGYRWISAASGGTSSPRGDDPPAPPARAGASPPIAPPRGTAPSPRRPPRLARVKARWLLWAVSAKPALPRTVAGVKALWLRSEAAQRTRRLNPRQVIRSAAG